MKPSTTMLAVLARLGAVAVLLGLACGPECADCENESMCKFGEMCIADAAGARTCARACSLTVWHDGPNNDAPCPAGEVGPWGTCPESCVDMDGTAFAHCTFREGLPDDVGVCIIPTGDPVCP